MIKVISGAWSKATVPVAPASSFSPGQSVYLHSAGLYESAANVPDGLVLESHTTVLDETGPLGYATVVRGIGVIRTDNFEGTVAKGTNMEINTATSKMRAYTSLTIVGKAMAAGTGGTDEVE